VKYIVLKLTVQIAGQDDLVREMPIIFPDALAHKDMAEAVLSLRAYPGMALAEVVSAGFLSCVNLHPRCHGESESLKIKSRFEQDSKLIGMIDYSHGIVLG